MRSLQVFILFLVIGAAGAMLYARMFGAAASPQPVAQAAASAAASAKLAPATPEPPIAKAVPGAPGNVAAAAPAPRAARPEPTDVETAQAKATRLAAKETFSREQLHGILEKSMAGKLSDRELTPSEYDRLANAILRIRASQRVLEGIGESDPGSEVRDTYADTLKAAFIEIQEITGVPPSGWGDVLADRGQPTENTGQVVGGQQNLAPATH